jgi:hypothetical protein
MHHTIVRTLHNGLLCVLILSSRYPYHAEAGEKGFILSAWIHNTTVSSNYYLFKEYEPMYGPSWSGGWHSCFVLGSNLGLETCCPDWGFSRFSLVVPAKCRDSASFRPRPLLSTSFPIHYSPIILSFDATYQGWPQRGSHTSLVRLAQNTFNNIL